MANKNLIILALVAVVAFFGLGIGQPGSVAAQDQPLPSVCTDPLSSAQTLQFGSYNYDKPGTAVSTSEYVYTNPESGTLNPGNFTTQPGRTYTVYTVVSSYFAGKTKITTGCNEVSPSVVVLTKAVDTSITDAVINSDGLTANTAAANQSLVAASTASFKVRLTPSALYKHLSGAENKFSVYFNATSAQNFSSDGFNLVSFDGSTCARTQKAYPNDLGGQVVVGFDCTGDFSGTDVNYRELLMTIKGSSVLAASSPMVSSISYVGWDYFQNTISGALESGPTKNDGSAIQTLQVATLYNN